MKKTVLVLTFIFTALISFTQTTWNIPKSEGSARNLTTVPGGFRVPNGVIMGRFADTTAANLTSSKFHDGSVILAGQSLYQRQLSSNRWIIIGNVGGVSTDTTSLSNRINTKLNITDTANIRLRPIPGTNITITGTYPNLTFSSAGAGGVSTDTTSLSSRINLKLNISDTSSMLSPYLRSAIAASSYASSSHSHNASNITSGTLPIARGGTGLSAIGTVGQSLQVATGGTALEYVNIPSLINTAINLKLNITDTASLSNRINLKLNTSDTASLSNRINLKANIASPTFTGTVELPAGQVVIGVTLTTAGGTTNFLRADGTYAEPASRNQTITLTGAVTGIGSTEINTVLDTSNSMLRAKIALTISDSSRDITIGSIGLTFNNDSINGKIVSASDSGMITPAMKAKYDQEVWIIPISDQTTSLTTGTGKFTFRVPYGATVTGVRASLKTASSSGIPTFDINENSASILSTKLTVDANEKTSTTAATAAVISDSTLVNDAEITIDIDVAGTGAVGGVIYIYHTKN